MRILIGHKGCLRKFVVIESSPRDGSLSLVIRRDGASSSRVTWTADLKAFKPHQVSCSNNKRITIHQTGRVNYHESGKSIFIEPLTRTNKLTYLYGYRVPTLDRLDLHPEKPSDEDAVFDLSELGDNPVSFSIFIGPPNILLPDKSVHLNYEEEAYSLSIALDEELAAAPLSDEDCFITLTPREGLFLEQQMQEDQAMICYHQAITRSNSTILYKPNGEGFVKLIFSVPMRISPKFRIELVNSELYVTEQDILREGRSDKVMLRFRIRNRRTKQIIREDVAIKSIELDAEL